MVSGGLGLIYLPLSAERLTVEQIGEAHPRLIEHSRRPIPGSAS